MLKGFDTSHHQKEYIFEEYVKQADFMIIKATEGKTYRDPTFIKRANIIKDMLCGYYHYARPENNTPEEEAENFVTTINNCFSDNAILILDWEGNSLQYPFEWALKWCELIHKEMGVKPIIYASASVIKKYKDLHGLWWTAHYNEDCKRGCTHDGGVVEVLTQYTSEPLDIDIFHGTKKDWLKLCGHNIVTSEKVVEWIDNNIRYVLYKEEV